jgi:hypothetical protein
MLTFEIGLVNVATEEAFHPNNKGSLIWYIRVLNGRIIRRNNSWKYHARAMTHYAEEAIRDHEKMMKVNKQLLELARERLGIDSEDIV